MICTAGGSTDDFTDPRFALRIKSTSRALPPEPGAPDGRAVFPDPQELLNHMLYVIENPYFRETARTAGPAYVRERFTWKHVVDRLLEVLLPA